MSGHSKWATTKHKKAVIDARRAKSFAKLIKNIEVAAKTGGADLSGNPTLVDAVQKAKKTSVPNDNIDRAIKRGAGLTGESIDYTTIIDLNGFRALVARHKGEVTAQVTVAEKLSDKNLDALKSALKSVTGKDVDLNVKVDPAIIGGLVVKLGSRMIDSSLRTKLNSIKYAMKEAR